MSTESSSGTSGAAAAQSRQSKPRGRKTAQRSPGNDHQSGTISDRTDSLKADKKELSAQASYEAASCTASQDVKAVKKAGKTGKSAKGRKSRAPKARFAADITASSVTTADNYGSLSGSCETDSSYFWHRQDITSKALFRNQFFFRELVKLTGLFSEQELELFDWSSMELPDRTFMQCQNDTREIAVDLLVKIKLLSGIVTYFHFEFQSSISDYMLYRMLEYRLAILREWPGFNPRKRLDVFPHVYQFMIYTGTQSFPQATELFDSSNMVPGVDMALRADYIYKHISLIDKGGVAWLVKQNSLAALLLALQVDERPNPGTKDIIRAICDKLKGAESDIIDDVFNYCKFYVVDMSSFRELGPGLTSNNWESLMVYIDERWKAYDEQLIADAIADAKPGIIADAKPGIIADAKPGIIADAKPGIIAEVTPGISKKAVADAFSKHNKNLCKLIIDQLCTRFGNVTDRLKSRLNAVKSPDTLASFIVLATSVKSIKDFEKNLEDTLQHQHA